MRQNQRPWNDDMRLLTYQNEPDVEAALPSSVLDLPYQPPSSGVALESFSLSALKRRRTSVELVSHQRLAFDLLIDCRSALGSHEVDFQPVRLRRGQIVHVRPGQVHRYTLADDFEARLVALRPVQNRRNWKPGPSVLALDAKTRTDLDAVLGLVEADGERSPLSVNGVEAIRILIVELLGLNAPLEPDTKLTGRVFAGFEALVGGSELPPRTVADCARELGCSTRTLGRACREFAAKPPKRMIDEAVALEGQRLLGERCLTATEVAHRLGFSELSHFSRFLSRVVGESPSAFIRRPSSDTPNDEATRPAGPDEIAPKRPKDRNRERQRKPVRDVGHTRLTSVAPGASVESADTTAAQTRPSRSRI